MAQQSKIELLLQLKDRISTGITNARRAVSQNADDMKRKISSFKDTTIRNFQQIKEAVPGLSRLSLCSTTFIYNIILCKMIFIYLFYTFIR